MVLSSIVPSKSRFAAASFGCLFLMCQLHIIAELVHHFHEGPVDDLLTMVILGSSGVAIDIKA